MRVIAVLFNFRNVAFVMKTGGEFRIKDFNHFPINALQWWIYSEDVRSKLEEKTLEIELQIYVAAFL